MIDKIRICFTQAFIRIFGKNTRISDRRYNQILYRLRTGRKADIDCPKTFNEHILARKIFMNEDHLTQYTDKYEVRSYVEKTIGSKFLVKNLGVWENPEEIPFDKLPKQYVLKATHGSGWNIIVRNSQTVDAKETVQKLKAFLEKNYYTYGREKNYRSIKPRIVCEEFIEGIQGRSIIDFKVFCFNGCAKFYSVTYFENGKQHFNIFDLSDGRLELKDQYAKVDSACLPSNIDEIINMAEKLAEPFDFVRVDFYIAKQGIYFSELTFHSGGGIRPIKPIEFDYRLGRYFDAIGGS
ncbi:MAG: ATP-grasp fold amidoligase family protein [Eubacteriales bacterium]